MRKRTAVSIPLFLAGIIMVLSFSVPHHHHQEMACFSSAHCATAKNGNECGHEHDAPAPNDVPCSVQSLLQADVIRQHQTEQTICSAPSPDFTPVIQAIIDWANNALILTGTGSSTFPAFYCERLHSFEGRATLAGRAPPVAIA